MTGSAEILGLLDTLQAIAWQAARVIKGHYKRSPEIRYKGPSDPVTRADLEANTLICEQLQRAFPGVPIVAEESAAETYAGRTDAARVFFVDPLDGTREFIAENDEFVVMIGVVDDGRASAGAIVAPAFDRVWVGAVGLGSFELTSGTTRTKLQPGRAATLSESIVVASRSHLGARAEHALGRFGARRVDRVGSAGLKGVRVASGEADVYVASPPAGSLWDACAIDAIVTAAGGRFSDLDGNALDYRATDLTNLRGLVASNGTVHDAVIEQWQRLQM
jgi:3'(2'), 5'-bisphosphate nucleotidase